MKLRPTADRRFVSRGAGSLVTFFTTVLLWIDGIECHNLESPSTDRFATPGYKTLAPSLLRVLKRMPRHIKLLISFIHPLKIRPNRRFAHALYMFSIDHHLSLRSPQ